MGEKVLRSKIMASMFGIPLSPECHIEAYRLMLQRIIKVAQNFSAFNSLSSKLQNVLLKNNINMIFSLRAVAVDKHKRASDQLTSSLSPNDSEMVKALIKDITSSPDKISKLKKIEYKTRMASFAIKDKYSADRHKLLETRAREKMSLNPCMISLISYVMLFSSDIDDPELNPNERRQVEKAQETLVVILQRYVYATCSRDIAYLRFSRIMESLMDLRELSDLMNNITMGKK